MEASLTVTPPLSPGETRRLRGLESENTPPPAGVRFWKVSTPAPSSRPVLWRMLWERVFPALHSENLVEFLVVKPVQVKPNKTVAVRFLTLLLVHTQPLSSLSKPPFKNSYQFMAPAASASGEQIRAVTGWFPLSRFLGSDFVLCP